MASSHPEFSEFPGMAPSALHMHEDDSQFAWLEFQTLNAHDDPRYADTVPAPLEGGGPSQQASAQGASRPMPYPEGPPPELPEKFRVTPIGVDAMDFEHRQLMQQLARVYRVDSPDDALKQLDIFVQAWVLHHVHEERHMEREHYPDAAGHKQHHIQLFRRTQQLRNTVTQSDFDRHSVQAAVEMMAHMVRDHIDHADALYAAWGRLNPA